MSGKNCPVGQKNSELSVKKLSTKFDASPSNSSNLATDYYHIADIGFGGIEITERYSATICYPTPDDCVTYDQELFGQDAHNMATGDFNGDGFEDLVVIWAIFPHTIEEIKRLMHQFTSILMMEMDIFMKICLFMQLVHSPLIHLHTEL